MHGEGKQVVVIGHARSGTSMVAGILYYMGVDMGKEPNPSSSNPKGDFEDDDFRDLNREIFSKAKTGSGCWLPPTQEEFDKAAPLFREKIKKLIDSRVNKKLWGWKNPWNVMAAPYFIPLLDNPHLIFVFRDPSSIARSGVKHTKRYEKLSFEEALQSAVASDRKLTNMVEEYKGSLPIHIIKFEDVIKKPEDEVRKMAGFLGIHLTDENFSEVMEFIIPRDNIKKERKKGAIKRWMRLWKIALTNPLFP